MHLDTGVVVELFSREESDPLVRRIQEAIGDQGVFWSSIQFGELADVCRKRGRPIEAHVRKVRALAEVVMVDEDLALAGSALKAEARGRHRAKDFSLIDGIILATARSRKQPLLTTASEFEGFPDAIVLE